MRGLVTTWLLLLTACGGGPAPQTANPPAPACSGPPAVALRFAWPPSLVAAVRGVDQTQSQNADGTDPRMAESYSQLRMIAGRDPGGPTVRFEVAGETRLRSQGFAPDVGGLRPMVHLGEDGVVRGVEGTAAMQERLLSLVRNQQISDESFLAIRANLTLQRQLASAQSHWDWVLGVWHGRQLSCGEVQRGRVRVPGMSFSTADVEVTYELAYRGAAPCPGPSVSGGACVELVATQRADSGQVTAAINAMPRDGLDRLVRGDVTRTIVTIAEPESLLPHRVLFDEQQVLRWQGPGSAYTRQVRDVQEYLFRYDQAALEALPPPDVLYDPDAPPPVEL